MQTLFEDLKNLDGHAFSCCRHSQERRRVVCCPFEIVRGGALPSWMPKLTLADHGSNNHRAPLIDRQDGDINGHDIIHVYSINVAILAIFFS